MRRALRALVALVLVAVPAAAQVIVATAVASPTQTRAGTQGAGGSVSPPSTLAALVTEIDRSIQRSPLAVTSTCAWHVWHLLAHRPIPRSASDT